MSADAEAARAVAVERHELEAEIFAQRYQDMEADRFRSGFTYGRSKIDAFLLEQVERLPPGSRVADIGCGTGEQLRQYTRFGMSPVGVEPARRMREIARRANPDVEVIDGSILSIPLPDEAFDLVSAIEVVRYLTRSDWPAAMSEMLRILRPGGTLFVTFLNRHALDGFHLFDTVRRRLAGFRGRTGLTHHEFVTPREVREVLTNAGVEDVRLHGRMLAPLRLFYKLHPAVGATVARRLDRLDDAVADRSWHRPFAGHLIAVARKPV